MAEYSLIDMVSNDKDDTATTESLSNKVAQWLAHGCDDYSVNVFKWYEHNVQYHLRFARAARDLLLIPGTLVPSERGFLLAGLQMSRRYA